MLSVSAGIGAVNGLRIELFSSGEVRPGVELDAFARLCELPRLAAWACEIAPCAGLKPPRLPIEARVKPRGPAPCARLEPPKPPPIRGSADFNALAVAGFVAGGLNVELSCQIPRGWAWSGMLPLPADQLTPVPAVASRGAGAEAAGAVARHVLELVPQPSPCWARAHDALMQHAARAATSNRVLVFGPFIQQHSLMTAPWN